MKKEKKEEGKVRVLIMMVMMMVMMGCNSGGRDPEKVFLSEMVNLGKGFLDVFVSFGDMITGTLGIKAETKKSEIGKYFTDIAATMESVKNKLQTEVAKNGNYEKVKTVVEQFITGILDKIAEGAKEAAKGATGDDAIGGAPTAGQDAAPADATSVNALVKGIKEIVGVVLNEGKGSAEATKTNVEQQKTIGVLFGEKANGGEEKHAAAVSASVGAISGVDMLRAIAKGTVINDEGEIEKAKNAAEIAAAKKESQKEIKEGAQKDAVIAGGIALRGMAKGGKFAAKQNEEKSANAVNGAVASAVNKVLSTLVIAIRNTVDEGLKGINKVLGEIKQGEGAEVKSN
ncbi:Variable outer membrane protein [Borrelia duttonii CR2A]|uniref:Variable large protein n=1 Tax=Borrelia duttonii CR2A TaxID=1432657 RepID=W6TFV6_9SPIR|nr:variable large family protein [Borrelia duttonii]ETZ17148.1 Variable outer membrane protein [Borrelia duttonii CR2A]